MIEGTKCVLVIDDERDIRELTKVSLESTGPWEVLLAGSGEDGISMATEHQPDVILLDAMMPGLDGLATLQRLQASSETSGIPVLMFTAKASKSDRLEYTRFGARAVVTKPFDPLILGADLNRLLGA
jgi:CheY-like chemotaxis protein